MTDFQPGWPCVPASTTAPAIDDKLSAPTGDELLPQILALTPRGPAWGTDEAGDGKGASPLMRLVWSAIAKWSAASYAVDFILACQAIPSLISYSLVDWEAELGLPDPCVGPAPDDAARRAAVRAKYAASGGSSPNYFICLAQALGFLVCAVEEFRPTRIGDTCGTHMQGPAWAHHWRVHASLVTVNYARVGLARIGDQLATWGNKILECAIRAVKPAHTTVSFAYDCGGDFLTSEDDRPLTGQGGSPFLSPG